MPLARDPIAISKFWRKDLRFLVLCSKLVLNSRRTLVWPFAIIKGNLQGRTEGVCSAYHLEARLAAELIPCCPLHVTRFAKDPHLRIRATRCIHTHTHLNRGERLHVASLLQEDALGDLQQLSQPGRTTDPRKELSLLKASLGGLQVGWPAIMTGTFR